MFTGHFINSIDNKGRVSLPSNFRQLLNKDGYNSIFITKSFDNCLTAYPPDEWKKLIEKISNLPQSKREVKAFQRFVISSAVECQIDKQGRILIPQALRAFANIEKEVLFAGIGNQIEIWSKAKWDEEEEKWQEMLQNSEALSELGV